MYLVFYQKQPDAPQQLRVAAETLEGAHVYVAHEHGSPIEDSQWATAGDDLHTIEFKAEDGGRWSICIPRRFQHQYDHERPSQANTHTQIVTYVIRNWEGFVAEVVGPNQPTLSKLDAAFCEEYGVATEGQDGLQKIQQNIDAHKKMKADGLTGYSLETCFVEWLVARHGFQELVHPVYGIAWG